MQLQSPKPKIGNFWHIMQLLFAIVILISISPSSVWAQEPEVVPQIVTLFNETEMCGNQVHRFTLEIWNVGSEGGDAYAEAIVSGYDCVNDEFGNILKQYPVGTFSGGPNGIVNFESSGACQLVDGKTLQCGETGVIFWIVQNPEAFDAWLAEPKDCTASISLPSGLKSGDDIWMSATYADLDGVALASETIISEAWIINGQAGVMLTTWDGKAMKIELQYTCPDGTAHTAVYDLPASQESIPISPPETAPDVAVPPEQPELAPPENNTIENNETKPSPLIPLVVIVGILAVGGSALVGTGAIIYGIVRTTGIIGGKTTTPPKPVSPPSQTPIKSDRPLHFDYPKPPTKQEFANLKLRRADMDATIEEYKSEWQETKQVLHRLQRTQKKNLIKRMLQLGIETQDIVGVKNPVDVATKILSIPVEAAIGKPSPEEETKILLAMDKLINNMKGKLKELQGNVKHLRKEIRKIDKKLAG